MPHPVSFALALFLAASSVGSQTPDGRLKKIADT